MLKKWLKLNKQLYNTQKFHLKFVPINGAKMMENDGNFRKCKNSRSFGKMFKNFHDFLIILNIRVSMIYEKLQQFLRDFRWFS